MRKSPRGTTLPELLIVMGIMGILLYLAQKVIVFGYEFYRTTDEAITLQREGLLAMNRITADLSLTHHASLQAFDDPDPTGFVEESAIVPLPRDVAGKPHFRSSGAEQGALTWRSLAAWGLDTTNHRLMRYLVDSADMPGGEFFIATNTPPDDYIANVEEVQSWPSSIAGVPAYPSATPSVAARHVIEFDLSRNVDTVDVSLTIYLTGKVRNSVSLDNSLTLQTTVFPKN